jgi:guanylate kinase
MAKTFLTLTGPAGVGKSPLQEAVNQFYNDLLTARPVLCHSRKPRVDRGEIHGQHYYFLPPALIKSLDDNENFLVAQVRSDWQAIDLLQIADLLENHDLVFAEVFYTFGPLLNRLASQRGFTTYSVFLLPVDKNPHTESQAIVEMMQQKLVLRGTEDIAKIGERARLAPVEMQAASQFTHRLLNPASEDNVDEWGEFGTRDGIKGKRSIQSIDELGPNARWLVETVVEIATGQLAPGDYRRNASC